MKKFFGLFILAISLFVLSCSNFSNVGDNSTLGKIAIQLPASSKNARNVIVASAESTEYYVITLEGPSPTSVRDTGGSVVTFEELLHGEYTITVEAYSVEGYCISSASATAIVRAGETTSINLALPRNVLANTKFALWNYDNGSYNFKTFSSTPTSNDLIIPSGGDGFTADNTCVVEDNDGVIYYFSSGVLMRGDIQAGSYDNVISAPLYCDETKNYIYVYCYTSSNNNTTLYCIDSSNFVVGNVPQYTVSGMPNGQPKMFAIRGSDFYFVLETTNYVQVLYHATLTFSGSSATANNCKSIVSVLPSSTLPVAGVSEVRGNFTDITIASDGNAYALICDSYLEIVSKNIADVPPSEAPEQKVYSRGAIIKISPDGSVSEPLGYHSQERKLTTANYENKPNVESSSYYYLPKMSLYAPSFSERSKEFYGPQKIIAKKPDELYIVDSGVNFVLSNFKPNTKQHNGNAYLHDRIMKVDLKNFGLSLVAEKRECYYSYTESTTSIYANAALFTTHNFSGSFSLTTIMYTINNGTAYIYPATLEDEI